MAKKSITITKNYNLFKVSADNRDLCLKRRKKLRQSMEKYGFLWFFPIVCHRVNGQLFVRDGQHRLAIASELGLPVAYVVADIDFDVAEVNSTPKTWQTRDYCEKFRKDGKKPYAEAVEFSEMHNIPIARAVALLAGSVSFSNVREAFLRGDFKVKDRAWADSVASVYSAMCNLSSEIKTARFLEACMMVCRVDHFDAGRLVRNARRCREKLIPYSTKDAYLEMVEEIYNFGHRSLCSIKIDAIEAMRARSPVANNEPVLQEA